VGASQEAAQPQAGQAGEEVWARQKVLRDTGLLMASVTGQGSGHVETLTATSLVYGTNLVSPRGFPYPAAHQHGTRNMVARPFLGISAKAADVMAQMCADFVRRRMVEG
jgi:phage gpG-like protein